MHFPMHPVRRIPTILAFLRMFSSHRAPSPLAEQEQEEAHARVRRGTRYMRREPRWHQFAMDLQTCMQSIPTVQISQDLIGPKRFSEKYFFHAKKHEKNKKKLCEKRVNIFFCCKKMIFRNVL